MCSVPGIPTPGSEVSVVVTRVNLNQNCGLVELWVNMNKEIGHVYEQMKAEIQLPQRNFCGSEGRNGDLCLVNVEEKWHRARIVDVRDEKYEVFLIDLAQPHSTTSVALAWGKDECFILPPEIESCVLANILSIENNWPEQVVNFLKSLPGKEFEGLVQHALMPDRTILLDVPIISKHLCKKGVAKKIPVAEFKNLVLKCLNLPEDDAIEPMSTEQSLNACNQLQNGDCYFYPELFTNTFESIRVTEVIDAANVFCQLVIFSNSVKILSDQINEEYKHNSAIEDVQPQTIGIPCAAKGVDGKWRRAVIKQQIASNDPNVAVVFVDEGRHELVQATNVKKLDPKYLRMPVVTYHCILEGVSRDKEWTKEELDHLKSLLLNQNIVARFERHILPGDSYSVSLFTTSAACINDSFMEKKDQEINGDAKHKFGHPLILNGAAHEVAVPSIFPRILEQDSFTHTSPFSPLETPLCDLLTVGANVAVKVSCIESPSKFWCQTSQCDKKLNVLMKELQSHYASVHPKPLVESVCVARNPDNNMWYRAKIIANQQSPDVEVRFVDYGQTKKVPLAELRPIDPTFLRLDAQAFQCSLVNVPPTDINYAKEEFHKFVDSSSAQTSGLKCVIKAVSSDNEGMLLNMVDLQTQSESASQVLVEKLAARPETFIQSSHNIEVNSKEKICISYSETVHSFYGQLERNLPLFRKVQDDIKRQMANYMPSDLSPQPNSMCIARYTDSIWYRGQVLEATPDFKVYFVDLGQTLTLNKDDIRTCAREVSSIKTIPVLAFPMGLFNLPEVVPQEINEWFAQKVVGVTFTMSVIEKGQNGKLSVELVDGTKSLNAQVREKIVYVEVENKHLCNGAKIPPMSDMEVDVSQPEQSQKVQNGAEEIDDWIFVEAEPEVKNGTAEKESTEEKMETVSEQTNNMMEVDNEKQTQPKIMTPRGIPKRLSYKMPILSLNKTMELFASSITSPDFFWCQCSNTGDLDKVTKLAQIEGLIEQDMFFPRLLIPGDPCLALYKSDNQWYRAQVIQKNVRTFSVVFIDYGNEEDIEYKDVRPLSASLLEMAPQAFLCCLDEIDEMKLKFGDKFCDKFYKALVDKPLKVKVLSMGHNSEINVPQYNVQVEDASLHKLLQKAKLLINGDALYERPVSDKTVFYSDPNALINQTIKVYASSITTPGFFWCQYTDSKELDKITKIAQKSGWAEDPLYPETLVPGSPCLALYSEENEWCRAQIMSREKDMFRVVFIDYGNEDDVPLVNVRPIQPRLMEIKPQAFLCYMENFDENLETWNEELCEDFFELLLDKVIKIKILSVKHNEEVRVPQYTVQFDFDMVKFCKSYVSPRRRPQTTTRNVPNVSQKTPAKAPEANMSTQDIPDVSQKTPVVDLYAFKFTYPHIVMNNWVKAFASSISGPEYFWCRWSDSFYLDYVTKRAQTEGLAQYDADFANSLVPGSMCLALFKDDNKWNRAQIRCKTKDLFSVLFVDYGNEEDISLNNVRPMSPILLEVVPQAFLCCLDGFDLTKGMWDDNVYDAFNNLIEGKHLEVTPFRCVENEEIKLPQFVVKVVCNNVDVKEEMLKYWKEFDKIDEISSSLAQSISISAPTNLNLSMQRGLKKPNVFLDRTEEVFATCIVDPHYFWCQFANSEELDKIAKFTQDAGRTQELPSSLDIGDLCVALFSDDSDPDSDNLWYRAFVREKTNEKLKVAFIDYGNEATINFKDTRLMPQHLVEQPPLAFLCSLNGFDKTKGAWEEKGCDDFFSLLVEKRLKVKACSMEENQELAFPQYSVQIECDGVDVNKLMEKYWKGTTDESQKSSLLGRFFGF